jgi:hypothetical protein
MVSALPMPGPLGFWLQTLGWNLMMSSMLASGAMLLAIKPS